MKEGKPIPSSVVTLMVTPADAERIALAQTEGQIMLALRNPLDMETTQTLGIRTTGLMEPRLASPTAAPRAPVPAPRRIVEPAPVPAAPAPHAVETIKAGKRDTEILQ
jgi:pilus assembly protein CpaB